MKQTIPKPIGHLIILASRAATAAANHSEEIHLAHNTSETITVDAEAAHAASFEYGLSCDALRNAYKVVAEKSGTAKSIATITREILKLKLGNQHSQRWTETGFAKSLAMPRSAEDLYLLLMFLANYLANNPGLQVPDLNVTADFLGALSNDLRNAVNAVNANLERNTTALRLRNQKVTQLRKRMSDLVAELKQLISPDDGRWYVFGLNRPSDEEKAEAPEEIEVVVVNETKAMIEFRASPRANYYRVYQRVVGVDAEPVPIGSPTDPDFTAEELPQNATIEFYVSAVNGGGESRLSEPAVVQTGTSSKS